MLTLFIITRITDIFSTIIGYYRFHLIETNPYNRFLLKEGVVYFLISQVIITGFFYYLAKKYKLVKLAVSIFTLFSIPFIFINLMLLVWLERG